PTWESRKGSEVGGKEEVTAESKIMCQWRKEEGGFTRFCF
ncbi:unnamed protein product, partial [Tetraodon nigroviridis]